jgi:sorbitol-specific phosphotransferase system component IIA
VSDIPVNKELDDETVTFFKTGSPEDLAEKMKMTLLSERKHYLVQELIEKNNKSLTKLGNVILSTFIDNKTID